MAGSGFSPGNKKAGPLRVRLEMCLAELVGARGLAAALPISRIIVPPAIVLALREAG
jgi:hypothetical protein